METPELLFAIQLRQLAAELRSAARAQFYAEIFDSCDEAQRRAKLAAWEKDHLLSSFIPLALEEVEEVAGYVQELSRAVSLPSR